MTVSLSHSMAPFGTFAVVQNKPNPRATWGPNSEPIFYSGPALEHYRSWLVPTADRRVTDTVTCFPAILIFR